MTRNLLLTLFAVVISATFILPQTIAHGTTDSSPNLTNKYHENLGTRAMWDLQFSFDLNVASGEAGNAGAEFDGTYFYTTRWGSNLIHKYDMSGNLVEEFSIPGVSGLRDLAFDGTYFYGGAASTTIYQMDFVSKTLIGTITSPVAVRFIAYDDDQDAFWCGNWSDPPTLVSRTGSNLGSFATGLAGQYGAAYDNVSPGGPFLWIFDQGGGVCPGSEMIIQYDIASGTATGVSHDACSELTDGIAGGLFSTVDFVSGKFSIGGVVQSNSGLDDTFFIYEVADAGPQPGPGPATNPNPPTAATDVDIDQDISWDNASGATAVEVFFGPAGSMTSVYSGAPISTFDVGTMSYNTTYTWRVNETDGTGTTTGSTWSFTTMQDPNLVTLFMDDFESGTGNYTITTANGCPWDVIPISSRSYQLPSTAQGNAFASDADLCGSSGGGSSSTAVLNTPIDATLYPNVAVEWDNDWQALGSSDFAYLDVSVDGGTTWMNVVTFDVTDVRNTHEYYDISSMVGNQQFVLRLVTVQPAWDWWWAIDNLQVTGWGAGGTTAYSEDFEGFTAGQQVACQDTVNWTTWSNLPCNATEDPMISDAYAYSGSNSALIVQNNDLVKPLGTQTSGTWYVSLLVYIPTGKAGYFNTLNLFDGNNSEWGMECYLNAGGNGQLMTVDTVDFAWAENTWQQAVLMVDLDADMAEFYFGTFAPLPLVASWQWSRGGTLPLQLDANDFFGATANDEMYIDNYYFGQAMPPIIPVEFTTFSAKANNGDVVLNWSTSTETNNRGFEVQRSNGQEFTTIGFVNGNGTSTQSHEYSFADNSVATGKYSYRLKQVDFDGSFAYSKIVEVNVVAPMVYSLAQNYPNPFNPTTQINFSLSTDSKVTLRIFDILGQEVSTLLNGNLLAGPHYVNFDASKLTSGVYLYRIDATGADGSNFTAVKKMLLTK